MRRASAAVHDAAWRCTTLNQRAGFGDGCPMPMHAVGNEAPPRPLLARAGA